MATAKDRPKPALAPEYCKACLRCIEACALGCISAGGEVHPLTGFTPVVLNLERCTACGLCLGACPEPYGLTPVFGEGLPALPPRPSPAPVADQLLDLPQTQPLMLKGTYASAIGAILAGCRHFYGYPITPSTEGAELMAKLLPSLDGVFVQAISEVATINMMYGCGAAGKPSMTFTSSPGFSLMLEGLSYMIIGEVPAVVVNVMRGGPGLGNIGPEQADIKLGCRGLGHGNTHAIVLAPASPQEMLDLSMLAFELSFTYRNPVLVFCDGYLGQMTGRVDLPRTMVKPGIPGWAVWGDAAHRGNLVESCIVSERDLELLNVRLIEKYDLMTAREQRADLFRCEDADVLLVACNTPSRMAKGAVQELRRSGVRAGLFRPVTLWPFPIDALRPLLPHVGRIEVVECSDGQLEDEMRLALSHAGVAPPPIGHLRHYGGMLPEQGEIVQHVLASVPVPGSVVRS